MSWAVKNYEIHRILGEGGMGTVFYAIEVQLRREVALKCLRHDVASRPGVADRFRNEAQAQARLNHPQIAHLYEYFQAGAEHYMAMEFVDGSTFAKVLRERGRLPYGEAGAYAVQVLRGLEHAHKNGIVHRDIKPANVMINKEGQVKVTDFGIARLAGSNRATHDGMVIGTYEYISPEAAQGLPTSGLSDIYSLGVVLYELITGRLPFESQQESELLRMQIRAPRPSVRSTVKDVPATIDDIVQRAMERKASRRFRSAGEMADALERCLEPAGRRNTPIAFLKFFSLGGEAAREKASAPDVAERRRTDISSTCHRVEDLLEQHLWNEAGSVLEAGLRSHPDEIELVDLRGRIQRQRQQYEQAIARQAELIRDLLSRGFAAEALKVAGNSLTIYPRAGALLDLQKECRQRADAAGAGAAELAQVQERVEGLLAAGHFQAATDYLLELHEGHENQTGLNKLLAVSLQARRDAGKQAAVLECMSQARAAAEGGEWEQAFGILDEAAGRFAGEAKLQDLRAELQSRRQAELRRRMVETALAEARGLELSGSLPAARDRLARGLDAVEGDTLLRDELARIDAAIESARRQESIELALREAARLRHERKWQAAIEVLDAAAAAERSDPRVEELRTALGGELAEHRAAVSRASGDARRQIRDGSWEEAVLSLSTALRELPGEQELTGLMLEAQRGLAENRRAGTIARIKLEAEDRARSRDYSGALRLLLDAVSQYPEDGALNAALSKTIFERDTYLTREQVTAVLGRAYALRDEGHDEAAIEVLRAALGELPGNNELLGALSELERAWRESRLRLVMRQTTAVAQSGLDAEVYAPALERLARELAEWPDEPELLELDRRVRDAQRQTAVRRALSNALACGKTLEEEARWDELARLWEQTVAEFPETAGELGPPAALARTRAEETRRGARIAGLERAVKEWIESGLLEEGDEELRGAEKEFPGESAFARLRETIARERQRIARQEGIEEAVHSAGGLLERKAFDDADAVLRAAIGKAGPDPSLTGLAISVDTGRKAHLAAVAGALAEIQSLFEKGDWEAALAACEHATGKFPNDARFPALLDDARKQRERERRLAAIERAAREIDELLGKHDFDAAEIPIRSGLRDYPGEAAFVERSRQLHEEREAHSRETAFQQLKPEVNRLREQRQWERARQLVAPYRERPGTRAGAEMLSAELSAEETRYRARARALEERARRLAASKQHAEAIALLQQATAEFPELSLFSRLLDDVREGSEAERKVWRLDSAERTIRSLLAMWRHEDALAEVDEALKEYPGEPVLRSLRALVVAGIEEKTAVSAVVSAVERLIASGEGSKADRALVDGLRRYPGRAELSNLQAAVDAARKAEWERESREAGLKRAGAAAGAGAAPEGRNKTPGEGAAPEVAREQESEPQRAGAMQADQAKPLAAERKAQRLSTAERLIQSRIAEQRYDEALAEADRAIGEYPAERSLRALRAAAQTGIQEKAAVAGVAGEVLRLIAAGDGGQAEQVLMDSLRRYPGRKELTGLRAAVDAARRSPRTHPSREPALKRAFSEIEKLLGMGKLP